MRRSLRHLLVLAMVAAVSASVALPAGAGGGRWERVSVSGNSLPVHDCPERDGTAGAIELVTGEIQGCLYFIPSHFKCIEKNGFDLVKERGSEIFVGTYNGEPGEFTTKYTLEATYAEGTCATTGDWPWENQKTGGCDHFVKGTKGAFKGARGVITFHDVVEQGVGATNFLYTGNIRIRDK